jgi:hypothetical protein
MQSTRSCFAVSNRLLACLIVATFAAPMAEAQGPATQAAAKLAPASGSWGDFVTLSGDVIAKAESVRAVWYPNDDDSQQPAMSQTVTVRGRTAPDSWQIQIPQDPAKSGWSGDFGKGVLRIYVTVPGTKEPVFAARFSVGGAADAATSQSAQAVLGGDAPAPPPGNPPAGPQPITGGGPVATATVAPLPAGLATSGIAAPGAGPGIDPRLADQPVALDSRPRGESPKDVQAVATGAFEVAISWLPTECASGYTIERSDADARAFTIWRSEPITPPGACTGTQIPADRTVSIGKTLPSSVRGATLTPAAPPRMSYADHAVRFGTRYRYRVGAVYTDHATGFATGVETTTPSANPATVTAALDGHGGVNVSWSSMPGAAGYTLAGDGLQAPRTDTTTQYRIARVAGGERSWTVVANYDTAAGRVTDTDAPARATLTVPIPPHAPGLLTKPVGPGSSAVASAHLDALCEHDLTPDNFCLALSSVLDGLGNGPRAELCPPSGVPPPPDPDDPLGDYGHPDCEHRQELQEAVYANTTDLGTGRRAACFVDEGHRTDDNQEPYELGRRTICYASVHGPLPGEAGFADPAATTAAAVSETARFLSRANLIVEDDHGIRFGSYSGTGSTTWWGDNLQPSTRTTFDTEGPKLTPFACMACHGGRYNNQTQRVEGGTLLPLDPSLLAFSTTPGFTRADREEQIQKVNLHVLDSNPSPAVAEYINGLYDGTPRQDRMRADDNYVPQGWATHAPFYRAVIKPYCITCHLAAPANVNLMSYANMMRNAAAIFADVCQNHAMPHAELTYRRFWSDSTLPFPADQLAQALGHTRCE